MSHLQKITLMTDIYVRTILGIFGAEVKYIQNLMQDMLDWKYVTVLNKQKMNGKEQNYQRRLCSKVYINYLRIL